MKKTCKKGHIFFKTSDCPVCPKCEALKMKEDSGSLPKIGAPATRALKAVGINTLKNLSKYTEEELREFHAVGPKAISVIKTALAKQNLLLKNKSVEIKKVSTVDEYIVDFPTEIQKKLQEIRATIKKSAPDAKEVISYAIPAFKLNGIDLVYFAGFKNHIGFYATPTGHKEFVDELSKYKQGKGSVQFPLDKPLPYTLITKIVKFRVKENLEKAKAKHAKI